MKISWNCSYLLKFVGQRVVGGQNRDYARFFNEHENKRVVRLPHGRYGKYSPMNTNTMFASNILVNLNGLFRINILWFTIPSWVISTDRNGRQIKGAINLSNLFKDRAITRIACKKKNLCFGPITVQFYRELMSR